jgi:uncharacterized membrane protein
MGKLVKVICLVLLLLLALVLVVVCSTCMFAGVGYVISCILPLNLFQGALLSIGAAFVIVFSISAIAIIIRLSRRTDLDYMDDEFEEDWEDEFDDGGDYDDDDTKDLYDEHSVIENTVKIGRNSLCHCGSGLKYKRCCGKEN